MSYYHLCCKGNHDRAPEKIRNIMLDEPSICEEVLQLWSIYYHFNWLNTQRKHLVFVPDGEMKTILFPIVDRELFEETIAQLNLQYTLISWSKAINYKYHCNAQVACMKDNALSYSIDIPYVSINCFLKHLVPVVRTLVEKNCNVFWHDSFDDFLRTVLRTTIIDASQLLDVIHYPLDSKLWYDSFTVTLWPGKNEFLCRTIEEFEKEEREVAWW